jgi:hypothetical protein
MITNIIVLNTNNTVFTLRFDHGSNYQQLPVTASNYQQLPATASNYQ